MAILLAILTAFILYPVLRVLWISVTDDQSNLTLIHFGNFFRRPLFREALWNTLWSGLLVVVFSSLLALPLAYVLAQAFPSVPLIGPRNLTELEDSLSALDIQLSPKDVKWLERGKR